ncbi:MAG: PAS domain S-box protein [Candidatus Omnitrophica bacterium]|nr:PAS domain S-box protein [Candidatus Omnitrophota bacterium]
MMSNFFRSQVDYIFFLYGLSFLVLSGACFLLAKSEKKNIPWFWLGLFALVHAVNEWLDLGAMVIIDSFVFQVIRLIVLSVSFALLVEFSRKTLSNLFSRSIGAWVHIPILSLVYLGWLHSGLYGAGLAAHFFLGFGSGLSASVIFFILAYKEKAELKPWLVLTGIAFGCYAFTKLVTSQPPHFLSGTLFNQDIFFSFFGFPIQLLRCALAMLCSFALWMYWYSSQHWVDFDLPAPKRRAHIFRVLFLFFIFIVLGWVITKGVGGYYKELTDKDFIAKVSTGAAAVNPRRILSLSASASDLATPDYIRLKEQIEEIKKVNDDLSFVYLMRLQGDEIIFLVDSDPVTSPDYSPPGQVYREAPAGLKEDFFKREAFILGPYTDRWGTWVSAYAPIIDFETQDVISRIGIDIEISAFQDKLFHHRVIGILIVFGLFILLISIFIIVELNKVAVSKVLYSQRHLQVLIDNIPSPIYYKNREGFYLGCNLATEQFLGLTKDKIIGRTVFDIFTDKAIAEKYHEMDAALFNQPGLQVYESKLRNIDGTDHDVIFNRSIYPGPDGKVAGLVGVIIDITEQKRAENSLRRLAAIVESSDDAIISKDVNGIITSWNHGAEKIYGYSGQEAIGRSINLIIPPEKRDDITNLLSRIKNGEHVKHYETERISKDGRHINISLTISPLKDSSGKVVGASTIGRDITSQVKANARINKLNKMQSVLFNPGKLEEKLKIITDSVVDIFEADFSRIWLMGPPDRCNLGCPHAEVKEGPHACVNREHCLHLVSSSGRYTHIEGGAHSRVPFGCYKIGGIASGEYPSFLTNEVTVDPRVHNHVWAKESGLVSFAGFRLGLSGGETIGVLALFSKHVISSEEYALLEIMSNITIRVIKAAKGEEELKNSEERFRQLFDSSRDAIMTMDKSGFIDCNNETLRLFGLNKKSDFSAKHPFELSPDLQPNGKDSLSEEKRHMELAFKEGVDFFEWAHKKTDGTVFLAEVLLSRLRFADKEYLQATVRDITRRKQAEEQIELAVEEWERTFNSIADLIFIQDRNSIIVKVNKSCCTALKLKPEEILGRKCYEILHGLNHPWPGCPALKMQKDFVSHAEEVDDPKIGVPLLVTVSPIFNAKGEFIGSVHVARDISERKKVENALREVIDMKTDFTSTVSHELRTPLAAIKEGISIVLDGTSGPIRKEQKEFLNIAKKNVDRLSRLINDILDFQKLGSGKMVFNMQANDINEVAIEAGESMRGVIEKKGLVLELELDKKLPRIQFDRDRIIQVFTNLINNAVKFTEKGSIRIQTARMENIIRVSVRDTGAGIKETDLPLLFERFKQLDSGMTRKTGGTGLGLSICKEIIEKHNGKVWVESKAGEGSVFSFTLPVT